MAEVIYSAWKNGTKFDAWNEHRKIQAWLEAFAQQGLDPAFYTHRPRRADEVFPWDHISAAVDCRLNCFAFGILPTFANVRRENPGETWKCPEVKSPAHNKQIPVINHQLPMAGD